MQIRTQWMSLSEKERLQFFLERDSTLEEAFRLARELENEYPNLYPLVQVTDATDERRRISFSLPLVNSAFSNALLTTNPEVGINRDRIRPSNVKDLYFNPHRQISDPFIHMQYQIVAQEVDKRYRENKHTRL